MKIAKVMAMMKRGKNITICRKGYSEDTEVDVVEVLDSESGQGPQWISNGRASYNLNGTSLIESASQFYTAYDVTEKQQDKFLFRFRNIPEILDTDRHRRWDENSVSAKPSITIGVKGCVLKAFAYSNRVMFIDTEHLTPFDGEESDFLEYEVRTDNSGQRYLCVYDGMMIEAIIYPVEFCDNNESLNTYEALEACRAEIWRQKSENKRQESAQKQEDQESLFNDEPEVQGREK